MRVKSAFFNPEKVAELGEKIYRERYKERYEREHPERFVAIDIDTGLAYLGETPEDALEKAMAAAPEGVFHLVQIGFSGAFRVAYTSHASSSVARIF